MTLTERATACLKRLDTSVSSHKARKGVRKEAQRLVARVLMKEQRKSGSSFPRWVDKALGA